jgi:hypothetical protein
MNDATREQEATTGDKLKDMFDKSSIVDKVYLKALAGLTVMMDSKLDRSIRFDAMKATVEMISKGGEYNALRALRDYHEETEAPLEVAHALMALNAIDELHRRELRFNTMMQLLVDEAEKRNG